MPHMIANLNCRSFSHLVPFSPPPRSSSYPLSPSPSPHHLMIWLQTISQSDPQSIQTHTATTLMPQLSYNFTLLLQKNEKTNNQINQLTPNQSIIMAQYDFEFTLVLVGGPKVGKTALLGRYANDTFSPSATTLGVDKVVRSIDVSGKRCKLTIWYVLFLLCIHYLLHIILWSSLICSSIHVAFFVVNITTLPLLRSYQLNGRNTHDQVTTPTAVSFILAIWYGMVFK